MKLLSNKSELEMRGRGKRRIKNLIILHVALGDLVIIKLVPLFGSIRRTLQDVAIVMASAGLAAVHHNSSQAKLVCSASRYRRRVRIGRAFGRVDVLA